MSSKISVIGVYEDVARDNINKDENGDFGYGLFNRLSRRAELRLIDWLSGDVAGIIPPTPYTTQKNKDWLAFLISPFKTQFVDGKITVPDDYYQWDNFYRIGSMVSSDCDDTTNEDNPDTPIEILDGQQYKVRCNTFIDEQKPSYKKPISKIIGNPSGGKAVRLIEATPKDLGSVVLEYIRYPVFAEIKTIYDPVYNDDIADPATSVDYEWDEAVREFIIWTITDLFTLHNREQALKKSNQETAKSPRG